MNKKKVNNRGITLVELIVALAILAMLMTAVIMMMSNNSVIYRKTKADITVQTSALETFNALQDSIMQAKEIELTGYKVVTSGTTETVATDTVTYVKPSLAGSGKEGFDKLMVSDGVGGVTYTKVRPTMLKIKYSVEESSSETKAKDNINCVITYYFCRYTEQSQQKCNIYVTRQYDSASGMANDMWPSTVTGWTPASTDAPTSDDRNNFQDYLYTSSLEEITLTVDYESQAIDLDMDFFDKSMNYNTEGVVRVRNSYVMKDMRDRTAIDIPVVSSGEPGDASGGAGSGGSGE